MRVLASSAQVNLSHTHTQSEKLDRLFPSVWSRPLLAAGPQRSSMRSDCAVPEGKPGLLVEQLLLQLNIGCSHKSLLALHRHFQHHPIQLRDVTVLQL